MITHVNKTSVFRHVLPPYEHQRKEFEKTRSWKYYALFWEMGTGKSKPLIDTAAWLFLNQEIDGLLLISDKGSYLNWPFNELPAHLAPEIPRRVGIWRSRNSKKGDAQCQEILRAIDDTLDIACVNIESLSTSRGFEYAKAFVMSHYTMTVIDESTSIKNPKSLRAKAAHLIGKLSDYRRIATGTPVTVGPLDLFSQCEFLEPGILGHRSYSSFRYRYAILREVKMGTRRFQTVAGYVNLEELKLKVADFSSRITKDECLDLPDKVYETQYIELTPEQKDMYVKLKDEAIVLLDQNMLSSTSAITTLEKLHQICCGHVKDDEGIVHTIPSNKMDALLELVEANPGKIVIWAHYQRDIENIMSALRRYVADNQLADYPVDYYGKTSTDDRVTAIDSFVRDPCCKWFVGSPSTGGKGITLTVSSLEIYYSCSYNLEHRLQSEDRLHRIGQKNNVTIVDLVSVGTVETKILKALKSKRDLAHELLDAARLRDLLDDDLTY